MPALLYIWGLPMLLTDDKENKNFGFIQLFAEKMFDNEIAEIFRDDLFSFGVDKNDYDFAATQHHDVDDLLYNEEAKMSF